MKTQTGHIALLLITLLAGAALILLALAFAFTNPTLAWLGGIGAAVLFSVQFLLIHNEFGKLYARIEKLESKTGTD
jgi:hypothetical protein